MFNYQAKIHQVTEFGETYFKVEFFDFEGIYTDGETLEEALENAQDALTGRLEVLLKHKEEFPQASTKEGKDVYTLEPLPSFQFAVSLRKAREEKGWTQQEIATRLHLKQQNYQKLEDPAKANPTLKKIFEIEKALGKKLVLG